MIYWLWCFIDLTLPIYWPLHDVLLSYILWWGWGGGAARLLATLRKNGWMALQAISMKGRIRHKKQSKIFSGIEFLTPVSHGFILLFLDPCLLVILWKNGGERIFTTVSWNPITFGATGKTIYHAKYESLFWNSKILKNIIQGINRLIFTIRYFHFHIWTEEEI